MTWIKHENKGSKLFFHNLKRKETNERIECLWEDGKNLTKKGDILRIFAQFYQKLFTLEDVKENMERVKKED